MPRNTQVLNALSLALEAKDQSVRAHSHRVAVMAVGLGRQVDSLTLRDRRYLAQAATLHDIGKVRVSEYVLNKPDRLTPEEFREMQAHAANGGELARAAGFSEKVWKAVRAHHERWDGGGYPDGLNGLRIPLLARIISIADCYDALANDRPYRGAMSAQETLEIIVQGSGSFYDPDLVRKFVRYHSALVEEVNDTPVPTLGLGELIKEAATDAEPQAGFFPRRAGSEQPVAA
jgi:putative nucleotidyltransferase with HDIG domain